MAVLTQRLRYAYSWLEKRAYAWRLVSTRGLVLPDFLGIGAQKAGTTWLYENLRRHPGLYLPDVKELHYFDWHFHRPLRWYARHFTPGAAMIRGEITPGYSTLTRARVAFVHAILPDARLVLLIRNPIERAWSQALMNLVTLPGRRYADVPVAEFRDHFHASRSLLRGDYPRTIDNWLSCYDPEQLYVGFYDDISERPRGLLTEILAHLGVSTDVDWSKFPLREVIFKGAGIRIPDALRTLLQEMYQDDLRRLAAQFGPRVAHWK